jgi:ferredoxin
MYKALKWSRVIVSSVVLLLVTFSFLYITGNIASHFEFLLKLQFVPAMLSVLSGSFLAFLLLLILTLLFGRIYCSVICPAGIIQDVISRVASLFKNKKRRKFKHSKPHNILRFSILAAVGIPFAAGITYPLMLLDPYSSYGRVSAQIFRTAETAINNLIASMRPEMVSHKAYSGLVIYSFALALLFLLAIAILSAVRGRLYCNTICPVGSLLGLFSRFSVFKPVFDKEKCVNCAACVRACKSECIDLKNKKVDVSRCVTCFDCMTSCDYNAIQYKPFSYKAKDIKPEVKGRREALAALGILAVSLAARGSGKGLVPKAAGSRYGITPPGSKSVENLKDKCTSCNACIAACPNGIIRPASYEYGIDGIMLPVLSYKEQFCGYECNKCSQVCPTGAILPVKLEDKKLIQIGEVNFTLDKCIVITDGTDCGACDEHCPTKAITMVPHGDTGLYVPSTNTELCIGCGGCEYICPAKPKAMIVKAKTVHGRARKPEEKKQKDVKVDEFGF